MTTNALRFTTPSDNEVTLARTFAAPRTRVFEAWTQPGLLKQWMFGPSEWPLETCEIDPRTGGSLRYEWRNPNGMAMGMSGVFREFTPPERIVQTELFDEDWTGGETVVTVTFEEHDGVTTITLTVLYSSREARDRALATDMVEGMSQTYERLDGLLSADG